MAKGSLMVGWGEIIPGREKAAKATLNHAMQYCMRLQQEGKIDSFQVVALEPHGSDLIGFVLVTGDKESVAQLRAEDEFASVMQGVQLVHRHVRVVGAYTGAELQSLFAMRDEFLPFCRVIDRRGHQAEVRRIFVGADVDGIAGDRRRGCDPAVQPGRTHLRRHVPGLQHDHRSRAR